jgi:aspartate-semialdehyde dehydrogenase
MLRVGIVGWRGMVGSVLVQRMREEKDFDHVEPVFFSTSQAGGKGPDIGKGTGPVANATDVAGSRVRDRFLIFVGARNDKRGRNQNRDEREDGFFHKMSFKEATHCSGAARLASN